MKKETIKLGIWSALGGVVLTLIIGFTVGGWVLGSTSIEAGEEMARNAITDSLAPMCVAQYELDPAKDQKLKTLKEMNSWDREKYLKEQGWSIMPFETEPDYMVARKCASLIMGSI